MNIESGPGAAMVQRFERIGGAISPRELARTLHRSYPETMPVVGAISGFA